MSKYVTKREDVYGGILTNNIEQNVIVLDSAGNELTKSKLREMGISDFSVSCRSLLRSMLFNKKNGLASDLVYSTPFLYRIQHVEPTLIDYSASGFEVINSTSLEEVLKYMGYNESLTQKDVNSIYRKLLVSSLWLNTHRKPFGFKIIDGMICSDGKGQLPIESYDLLDRISGLRHKPSKEEPCYKLILRK